MAFGKKSLAIALLGDQEDVKRLTPVLTPKNIQLNKKNFVACDELINALRANKDIEYVFLSDGGMMGVPGGKFEIIPQIHALKQNIYTIVFFNREKYSESYMKFAAKFGVKSIYYHDDPVYTTHTGEFDFTKILNEIIEKRRIYSDEINADDLDEETLIIDEEKIKIIRVPVETIIEKKEYIEVEKEVEKIVEKEVEKIVEIEREVEKIIEVVSPELSMKYIRDAMHDVMQEVSNSAPTLNQEDIKNALNEVASQMVRPTEKGISEEDLRAIISDVMKETMPKESYSETLEITPEIKKYITDSIKETIKEAPQKANPSRLGSRVSDYSQSASITVGIMNLSGGAGSTTTAVELAEDLTAAGYTVGVVAYDGKRDLNFAPKSKITYYIPEKNENKWDVLMDARQRRYQFILIDFGNIIKLSPNGEEIYKDPKDFQELERCHYKIALSFSNIWHIGKLGYFVSNDDYPNNHSYLVAIDKMDNPKALDRFGIQICERDRELINSIMFRKIGLR